VPEQGSVRKAVAKLADRERRVEKFNIRDLDPVESASVFRNSWSPHSLVLSILQSRQSAEADDLMSSLMNVRGYPVSDFNERAADISVDHPRVVQNYRSAHEIALRVGEAETTTEELRTAMIHYRWLIEELMQVPMIVERKEVA
jgi:hypothetical protein